MGKLFGKGDKSSEPEDLSKDPRAQWDGQKWVIEEEAPAVPPLPPRPSPVELPQSPSATAVRYPAFILASPDTSFHPCRLARLPA